MSELTDLIALHGAIDQKLDNDADARARVARLLPLYQDPDLRWFDEFAAWTDELRTGDGDPAFPSRDDALEHLAEVRANGRMRARRLWVVALAAEAWPELAQPDDGTSPLARALNLEEVAGDPGRAQLLLELLTDESLLPAVGDPDEGAGDRWWAETTQAAEDQHLIESAARLGPRPCTGRLVGVASAGGRRDVPALRTVFETDQLTFDKAITFLDPTTWPTCSALCCEVRPLGTLPSGVRQYREVVSSNCQSPQAAWTIGADLDFSFTQLDARLAIAEYQLSAVTQKDVLVDEGSLVVEEIDDDGKRTLRITTTKRVAFNRYFEVEQLMLMLCALGYASIVEDLIFTCAITGQQGADFPTAPEADFTRTPLELLITRSARAAQACIGDWAEDMRVASASIAQGRYTADALAQDLTRPWVRLMREGAALLEGALGGAGAVAGTEARGRGRDFVTSYPFESPVPGAQLALAGPLVNGHRSDALPSGAVTVEPPLLAPKRTDFLLRADVTDRRAGTYVGAVSASGAGGVASVPVWIIVP
jgi:hypothetical protein